MKSREPTPSEVAAVHAVVAKIEPDRSNARLVTLFALVERFSEMEGFSVDHFQHLARHGSVSKDLALAKIVTGLADNVTASHASADALAAARVKVASMFPRDAR